MDVDVATLGIDLPVEIAPGLGAGKPKDAGEYPIALGVLSCQLSAVYLAGRAAGDEDGADFGSVSDPSMDDMPTPRGAFATVSLAGAVARGGDRPRSLHLPAGTHLENLTPDIDTDGDALDAIIGPEIARIVRIR